MNTDIFFSAVLKKLSRDPDRLMLLQNRLGKMSQEEQEDFYSQKFPFIKLRNPDVLLLINFFLGSFGIVRFMVGDYGIGAVRLLITLIGFMDASEPAAIVLLVILGIGNFIWGFVDLFLVDNKVREQNLSKVLSVL